MLSQSLGKMSTVQCKATTAVCIGGGVLVGVWLLRKITGTVCEIMELRNWGKRMLGDRSKLPERVKEWPKDVVILHAAFRGKLAPHPSPFVLKLETFLRMHKIPYQFDCEFPFSEKMKMPWITLNGEHYGDSQLIMTLLTSKYNLKPGGNYSDVERATGAMARVLVDEHLFWGVVLWRFVYANGEQLDKMFNFTGKHMESFQKMICARYKEYAWNQGLGRYSQDEVIELMRQDLVSLSKFIGTKRFLLGDEPCDDDCAVFAMLAMLMWNDIKSPYTKFINEELANLREYAFRMKEHYWSDWDAVIAAGTLQAAAILK